MPEVGLTREPISQGRRRKALCGVGRYRRTDDILQDRRRKGTIAGRTKARMRFRGIKIVQRIRKPWEGKRPAGGRERIKGVIKKEEG
ncbi:hypothetical protein BY996DRAFT_6456906, partial [Phakopsora pachyrhizi]